MMFGKRFLLLGWLAMSVVGVGGASCADLGDAEPCYRFARLFCEKTERDDEGCKGGILSVCREYLNEETSFYEEADPEIVNQCSDKLSEISGCVGPDAFREACPELTSEIGLSVPSCDRPSDDKRNEHEGPAGEPASPGGRSGTGSTSAGRAGSVGVSGPADVGGQGGRSGSGGMGGRAGAGGKAGAAGSGIGEAGAPSSPLKEPRLYTLQAIGQERPVTCGIVVSPTWNMVERSVLLIVNPLSSSNVTLTFSGFGQIDNVGELEAELTGSTVLFSGSFLLPSSSYCETEGTLDFQFDLATERGTFGFQEVDYECSAEAPCMSQSILELGPR